ncbi:hypothetical protein SEA_SQUEAKYCLEAN_77 [Streptomyces phage SqueakyClean]|nr:hypothetical protein SEA_SQUEAKYCLEAN_77 [Streptomyces phage SqueakyClean]
MVSLAKTPESIAAGQIEASINRGLRKNGLIALQMEFGYRAFVAREVELGKRKS